jgi:hypothetical protein
MNCQAEGRFGFITCGSEQSGGIQNVYAFNNWSYGQGVGSALWVKSNSRRGGFTRNVNLDTFTGRGFRSGVIAATMSYGDQSGNFVPAFEGFALSHIRARSAPWALDLQGLASSPIGPVTVSESTFDDMDGGTRLENTKDVSFDGVLINGRAV